MAKVEELVELSNSESYWELSQALSTLKGICDAVGPQSSPSHVPPRDLQVIRVNPLL